MKAILFGAGLALALTAPARAADVPNIIAVTGYGHVEVAAQFVTVSFGVMTQGTTVAQTSADNAERMAAVIAALRRAGIAAKDIQTSSFDVSPRYAPRPPGSYDNDTLRPIIGYSVSNAVWVKLRDRSKVSKVIDTATAAGANSVGGVTFGIEDDPTLMDRAREAAVADARHKAQVFAAASQVQLGPTLSVTEAGASISNIVVTGSRLPQTQLVSASPLQVAGSQEVSETPIMERAVTVQANVTVVYAVK